MDVGPLIAVARNLVVLNRSSNIRSLTLNLNFLKGPDSEILHLPNPTFGGISAVFCLMCCLKDAGEEYDDIKNVLESCIDRVGEEGEGVKGWMREEEEGWEMDNC